MKKIKATSIAFAVAIVQRVVSEYALGILWDWHIFTVCWSRRCAHSDWTRDRLTCAVVVLHLEQLHKLRHRD